ncbi:MAG: hypothetical protein IT180_04695 [Acidobacteria bacterium]|nr:hypothetical protein [Acidobacteriota bacterium]
MTNQQAHEIATAAVALDRARRELPIAEQTGAKEDGRRLRREIGTLEAQLAEAIAAISAQQ